ncbi:DUF2075 domain-containing protein [Brevibacillus gelatini]|uniref:DUF2075 domain-containing protein n=1 Tax=Brevibacillus gelatini TaxID=1655277 RepID=A0A3M8B824_9BACL|nr:AAA family ATPase [Brevibacillus gelatini]RNB59519.1 DUF2075 domain-containing protein [Brevibacillus gelatini]
MSNEVEVVEIELVPVREVYYNGTFGVYACETDEWEKVEFNKYNNITINGQMPKLQLNTTYKSKLVKKHSEKYGVTYEVKEIKQDRPQTIQEQHAYIKTMLREDHANAIIAKYPNHDLLKMFENDEIDYSDIPGIGEKTYQKIKYFLLNHLDIQEALVKLSPLGVTFKMLHRLIEFYGDVRILMQKVEENIYSLCDVSGIGFKKVDQYALAKGIEKESEYRIEAGIEYTLQQEENMGHSYLEIEQLINKSNEYLKIDRHHIELFLATLQDKKQDKFYITQDIVALYKNYYYEKRIAEILTQLSQTESKCRVENLEEKIQKIEQEQGFTFTNEQKNVIHTVVNENVVVISGKAGTGKTTVLKGILSVLDQYSYETCALSGKAAMRITESGLSSKTIHRMLGYDQRGKFVYNSSNKLPYDIVILDEAGMVGSYLFYSLVSAIEKGKKFIIVGDTGQLSPIGAGNIFKDIISSGKITVCELTQVQRQAMKSGILSCANKIREGEQINSANNYTKQVYGELNDFHLIPMNSSDFILENLLEICKNYKGDIMDLQVITAMKTRGELSAKNINKHMQEIFNPNNSNSIEMNRGDTIFRVNDKIIHNGNNYEINVFNGQIGTIVDIEVRDKNKYMKIKFDNVKDIVEYEQSDLDKVDLAYAITCHRGQGSGWKNVIIVLDYSSYMLLNRQWVYTALTRGIKYCIMIAENRALTHAIRTNDANKRNTFLKGFLEAL